jgi:hypothetical protein
MKYTTHNKESCGLKWPCDLPVSCPGASRWFVEVRLCMASSCEAFLHQKKKKKNFESDHSFFLTCCTAIEIQSGVLWNIDLVYIFGFLFSCCTAFETSVVYDVMLNMFWKPLHSY